MPFLSKHCKLHSSSKSSTSLQTPLSDAVGQEQSNPTGMPDNHSVEGLLLSAEPETLDYLCNNAPVHHVSQVSLHRGSSQADLRSLNKFCGTMSLGHLLCCTVHLAMLFYMGLLSGC